jgi:GT2 family glycosyltransferase
MASKSVKLSILIPTIHKRKEVFDELFDEFFAQCIDAKEQCEILYECDNGELSKGTKRNMLMARAKGEYLCQFDDDDIPSIDYVEQILKGLESNPDCCSLRGLITMDGGEPEVFEHSIKYDIWKTNDTGIVKYERPPNHLNTVRSSIAKQIPYAEINHGEDHQWSTDLKASGLIKTESYIDSVIYNYIYTSKK